MAKQQSDCAPRARGAGRAALAAVALTLVSAAAALAQDESYGQFQFGPVDGGGGMSQLQLDRQFIREWEGNPEPGLPTLAPANIEATKNAIKRYSDIVAGGGWKTVPDVTFKPGETHFAVTILRDRLLVSGELTEDSGAGETYDTPTVEGVKRFQASNGLTPTGKVDQATVQALNISADARLKQLKNNLARLTEMIGVVRNNKKYVIVNIPAAQVEAVALNRVITRHAGVVGKPDRPTPLLRSTITEMNFNPIWRLPPTVIDKDLIPQGREMQAAGKNVLVKMGIDAYDGTGKKLDPEKINWSSNQPKSLSYRQQPGKENPLGFVKINFASGESVYMHDTPSNTLFGKNFRAASSGCIRVHNIERLAYWLLGQNDGWDEEQIKEIKASGKRLDVRLATPVPLYFVYITAWATEDGAVQFRRDLYGKDGVGEAAATY
jgi:murein L,D-transpeptidase YcbB/YkuD